MKRRLILAGLATAALLTVGCATLEERQREWIFQPGDRAWGGSASLAEGMDDVWIPFHSHVTQKEARLHGLWLAADRHPDTGPYNSYLAYRHISHLGI